MIHPLILSLLRKPSVSPEDEGCQDLLSAFLQNIGFEVEDFHQGAVRNFFAKTSGGDGPILLFAGHTDVVPPGRRQDWRYDPFTPTEHQGYLYARGAADMKVALACMALACESFLKTHVKVSGNIAFLVTSCEEKTTLDGTAYVMQQLQDRGEPVDYCIVGEPSSDQILGDQIKVGRRGSLSATITIIGKQGHVAYPHQAINPIHQAVTALLPMVQHQWDTGYPGFAPTTCQFSNIQSGVGATNVIPGVLTVECNFRYSPAVTPDQLKAAVDKMLTSAQVNYQINWSQGGEPFLSKKGQLRSAADQVIERIVGKKPRHSTSGGTSDARFIAPYGIELIELGFSNETIHQVDERIKVADIETLQSLYQGIMETLLLKHS